MFVKEFLKAQNSEKSQPGGNMRKLGHTPENTRQHFIFIHNFQIKERQTQERDRTSFCIALDQYTLQFHDHVFRAFCETSFKNGASYQCISRFSVPLSKVVCLPRKSDARSYEVLHLSRKIILANLKIWCSKMQPFSGNQRPDILTSLMNTSLVLRLPCEMHLCRSSSIVPRLPTLLKLLQNPHVLLTFDKVHNPLRQPRGTTSERPKVLRDRHLFASGHNGVHFSNISTSKSAPNLVCFAHFDFEMCFAPQRRATWCALYILTSKRASRHNGVQSFIYHLARWLRTRRFSERTFRPSGARNHSKNKMNRDFCTFSRTCIFFLLTLSLFFSDLLLFSSLLVSSRVYSSLLFSSLTLPTSAFPSTHAVGSFTSKLPSITIGL